MGNCRRGKGKGEPGSSSLQQGVYDGKGSECEWSRALESSVGDGGACFIVLQVVWTHLDEGVTISRDTELITADTQHYTISRKQGPLSRPPPIPLTLYSPRPQFVPAARS